MRQTQRSGGERPRGCGDDLPGVDVLNAKERSVVEEQIAAVFAWLAANDDGSLIAEEEVIDPDQFGADQIGAGQFGADGPGGGYADRLDVLLDDVAEDESALAMRAARRAWSVEQARAWAVVSDEFVLFNPQLTREVREEWVMRTFVSELGARLHLPQATAAGLVEESRTLAQLRSDVATELLLDGAVIDPADPANATSTNATSANGGSMNGKRVRRPRWGIRPTVFVTVPVMTLLGGEKPGQLDGYGPIDPDTARRLAVKAPSFIRLLTHPETGIVLSTGKKRSLKTSPAG